MTYVSLWTPIALDEEIYRKFEERQSERVTKDQYNIVYMWRWVCVKQRTRTVQKRTNYKGNNSKSCIVGCCYLTGGLLCCGADKRSVRRWIKPRPVGTNGSWTLWQTPSRYYTIPEMWIVVSSKFLLGARGFATAALQSNMQCN